jgi:hypothetical protein
MNRVLRGELIAAGAAALLVVCGCGAAPGQAGPPGVAAAPAASPAPQPAAVPRSAPIPASAGGYSGPLPPIPMAPYVTDPALVRTVYEFAARQPEVLRYVPCFCGCERNGHKGNEDCFIAGRAPDGRPQWDAHGMG